MSVPKLKVDFYESGIGETIVITFPSGGMGLVDAHPSPNSLRPPILEILNGKKLHFVCLTHPHADHGKDLVPVLEKHPEIESFWHTLSDIPAFIYGVEQTISFPSPVREFAKEMNQDWGRFLCNILGAVVERKIDRHVLRSDLIRQSIDGVDVFCLSPQERIQNDFADAYRNKLTDLSIEVPDRNLLSAVLAFQYGNSVLLLGGDALRQNWDSAIHGYQKHGVPKALVFKVPHHGARNSLNMTNKGPTYLDVCSQHPKAYAVIFAGDSKHPDQDVFDKVRAKCQTICLTNGRKSAPLSISNPLRLQLPGARAVYPAPVCNPIISFELDTDGNIALLEGVTCDKGCLA